MGMKEVPARHRCEIATPAALIDTSGESPSSTTYLDRLESMERVYRLIGYRPGVRQQSCMRIRQLSNERMLELQHKLLRAHGRITSTTIDQRADCALRLDPKSVFDITVEIARPDDGGGRRRAAHTRSPRLRPRVQGGKRG